MNGTVSTFDSDIRYTVLGRGPDSSGIKPGRAVSLISILKGRRYQRLEDIRRIAELSYFDSLIMLPRNDVLPFEELSAEFPHLRFFLFDPPLISEHRSPGALINLGIREAAADIVLCTWGGVVPSLSSSALERLHSSILCYVPELRGPRGNVIPSLEVPAADFSSSNGANVESVPVPPEGREAGTLAINDYQGLYVKERFLRTGGFEEGLSNPFWQKREFGVRSWLWGERINYLPGFRIDYLSEPEVEESTPDSDYLKYQLRTLQIRFTGDRGVLPLSRFWAFYQAGNRNIISAIKEFTREKKWVRRHRYHYRCDIRQLTELWGEDHHE